MDFKTTINSRSESTGTSLTLSFDTTLSPAGNYGRLNNVTQEQYDAIKAAFPVLDEMQVGTADDGGFMSLRVDFGGLHLKVFGPTLEPTVDPNQLNLLED